MISIGALVLGLLIVGAVTAMLLRRQLREKYAVVWLVIGLAVLLLGIFPAALQWLTLALGFQLPANLIFTLAITLLLAASLHLSWELTRTEERLRRLAEEAAIARLAQSRLEADVAELKALARDRQITDDE
ncbi:hypothetical protein ASF87_12400 [Microbacterium sp. Leaf161]|uniref:DUF2304 domain-containing protein n=1 Tax=Microbacterium sp. Leaf161 TaxID=1736281 RepID=UPI0006F477B6|nr:DUF2304 domain-containing protein [Microbacterium sp. Leaf161]KQR49530.1 hypothetical protein ASF87_12400 [Microbacterium sp. Leaf161]